MIDSPLPTDIDAQNEISLRTLARTIARAQGMFSLILVRCNYHNLQQQIVQQLRERCEVQLREIFIGESVKNLYKFLQAELTGETPAALMVFGLENTIAIEEILTKMNGERELFRHNFRFPILFWINDDILKKLIRKAPDLETWASTYQFTLSNDNLIKFIRQNTNQVFIEFLQACGGQFLPNSAILGKNTCLELELARQDLLTRDRILDADLEANLEFIRGRNNYSDRHIDTALEHYQQSLIYWVQESKNNEDNQQKIALEHQGIILFHIGICYRSLAEKRRAESSILYQEARLYLEKCLEIFETAERQDIVAKFISHLGEILQRLEAWHHLCLLAVRSLYLHKNSGFEISLAQDYGFLAEVALQQCNWELAKEKAEQALAILTKAAENMPSYHQIVQQQHRCRYLLLLAKSQQQLREEAAAFSNLEKAKNESNPQYGPRLYLRILAELRSLYFEKGKYREAFHIKQEQSLIETQYGFRAFIGAGRIQPQKEAINPVLELAENQPSLPAEITASGREQDVNNLLERISRADRKLTVIHGPSGVGKSSIIYAGLVPALKMQSIGTRDVVPIVLSVYTDWISVLTRTINEELTHRGINNLIIKPEILNQQLLKNPQHLIVQLCQNSDRNLLTVLIFDQVEEFFFVTKQQNDKRIFFEFLRICLDIPFVKVILSMREDYLHYLLESSRLTNLDVINNDILSKDIRYYLGNFLPAEAHRVIQSLSERAQFYLEPTLIDELVSDLSRELGEVRPIELQLVGSQLQAENITTLKQYKQAGTKEKLVERFLEKVIKDCGKNNERAARLVLYFLTDENDTRPLKSRLDIESDLNTLEEADKLDLVLEILVGSGLVSRLVESSTELYQLVHDYLAGFIREQQEFQLRSEIEELRQRNKKLEEDKKLLAELGEEKERRKNAEESLNRVLKWRFKAAVATGITLAVFSASALLLAIRFNEQKKQAKIKETTAEILQTNSNAKILLFSNDQLGALVNSVKAGKKLQENPKSNSLDTSIITVNTLQQIMYGMQEDNRLEGHKDWVSSITFTPDGKNIISGSKDGSIKIWGENGAIINTFNNNNNNIREISSISLSPDGQTIAAAIYDKNLEMWMVQIKDLKGKLITTFSKQKAKISSVAFSPDGKIIATGNWDKTVKIWQRDGKLLKTLSGHTALVIDVSFSPDGKILASAGTDKNIILWNSLNGKQINVRQEHTRAVSSVSFSPDGQKLVSTGADKNINIWSREGVLLETLPESSDRVLNAAFSPDGKLLATAHWDNIINIWNIKDGKYKLLQTLKGHTNSVLSLKFSPNSQILASASADNTIKLWKINKILYPKFQGHENIILSVNFSPDGQTIATASEDTKVNLWALDGHLLKTFPEGKEKPVLSVTFSPDGKTIATANEDDTTIKIWNIQGELLQNFNAHDEQVNWVTFSPDGETIASASNDNKVKLWSKKGLLLATLKGHTDNVNNVSFSPDGNIIASASNDRTVKLWNKDGKNIATLEGHTGEINNVTFSPDGEIIASASTDKTVKLWGKDGKEIQTLQGHIGNVSWVSFSPNGKIIATGSWDKTVRFWTKEGNLIDTFKGYGNAITSLSFRPDGKSLAVATGKKVMISNLDLNNLLKSSCDWLYDYLKNNYNTKDDRHLCD